ncbi:MAG: AAA-like domain-containing protein, partial [Cyanobacteriota bacterium]|nr:AAA-like domain-containing protein [Cyanobacteriota bacterium]
MYESSAGYHYQFGGSLPPSAPTYVTRKADDELYHSVLDSQFCYVLNSRQMGKSSLRVQTMQKLQRKGIYCATVDLTAIGSQEISADRWYGGIAYTLASSFNLLDRFDLGTWWCQRNFLSSVQRLGAFIQVLLEKIPHPIAIFVDEIDSVLGLNFPTDDFFAWIRSCYDRRGDRPEYQRLTWILLGVATPSELMKDPQRTPFDIGRAIDLEGFRLEECKVLARGLTRTAKNPRAVLKAILSWTGGQPFLTQKICQLVQTEADFIEAGDEGLWVERLMRLHAIHNWEAHDEPEHLRSIRDRLLRRGESSVRLLRLYEQLLA